MPSATEHKSAKITKLLYIGDSASGKTTSLSSLVAAGYNLRVFDFDNLLASLVERVRRDDPDKLNNIQYMSFRDDMKATSNGPVIDGPPKAFIKGLQALDKWEDGSVPKTWDENTVLVLDSLTTMSRAAYWWGKGLQGAASFAEGVSLKGYDPRQSFYTAQQAIMNVMAMLTADNFMPNVVVIAHVKYLEHDGVTKGFPLSIGSAISPEIASYFPFVALASKGHGSEPKRIIRIRSTNMIDLKNPRAFDMLPELPMETGLATIFERGP